MQHTANVRHGFNPVCAGSGSLLSEESIMFGARLVPEGPGKFVGSYFFLPLPVGAQEP